MKAEAFPKNITVVYDVCTHNLFTLSDKWPSDFWGPASTHAEGEIDIKGNDP